MAIKTTVIIAHAIIILYGVSVRSYSKKPRPQKYTNKEINNMIIDEAIMMPVELLILLGKGFLRIFSFFDFDTQFCFSLFKNSLL